MNRCDHCRNEFEGAAVGKHAGGRMLIFCGRECRYKYTEQNSRPQWSKPRRSHSAAQAGRATTRDRKKLAAAREADVSRAAASELNGADIWNTRLQSGVLKLESGHIVNLCTPGTPDRMFADGVIVFLEIKSTGEKPNPEQAATIAKLKNNGALVFVLDNFLQLDFIRKELSKHRPRIIAIRDEIRSIQNELETRFNERFGPDAGADQN